MCEYLFLRKCIGRVDSWICFGKCRAGWLAVFFTTLSSQVISFHCMSSNTKKIGPLCFPTRAGTPWGSELVLFAVLALYQWVVHSWIPFPHYGNRRVQTNKIGWRKLHFFFWFVCWHEPCYRIWTWMSFPSAFIPPRWNKFRLFSKRNAASRVKFLDENAPRTVWIT